MRRGLVIVMFLAGVAVMGCGDKYDGRQPLSGKVTIKGAPLKEGSIQFNPLDGQTTSGGCGISNGEYKIDAKDGLKPGKYQVRITAGDGVTPANDEEVAGPGGNTNIVSVDIIPPEFNVNSNKQVEIKTGGPNVFDFDIPNPVTPKGKKR